MQRKIGEPEIKSDFEEFCRYISIKWYFRTESSENFSDIPSFRPNSSRKPPMSKVEQDLFKTIETPTRYSNLSRDE